MTIGRQTNRPGEYGYAIVGPHSLGGLLHCDSMLGTRSDPTMNAKSDHPYRSQPPWAFWRQAVQEHHFLEVADWYRRKWTIEGDRVATAGSCFAQHIGRRLRGSGFRFVDVEPAPSFLAPERHLEFGYGMYSARYGNVYTTRQLLQLVQQAFEEFQPQEVAWSHGTGWVDAFRPTIEPQPLTCVDEVLALRAAHLTAVRQLFESCDLFVFTLGLTEAWISRIDGAAYPVCPGTSGGTFDPARHVFANLSYTEVLADMESFIERVRQINPRMRFLLTVSPVPLMATATPDHVAVATSYSKSVLRAVAGHLAQSREYVDYFPSYEIISSTFMRGAFYNPDQRTVVESGVEHVMRQFFKEHIPPAAQAPADTAARSDLNDDDVVCDEELLAAFGERA
ncbi:GSCFA domain-containing protein [Ideonella sp. DXS29W]|uniref:GSCFA domain-containing protein n=1 Tax=Ideonella lacteola TaxID=2984193 RepID=A0ABU9BPG5_9BURK